MDLNETNDSIRLIIAMPPRHYFGGNDWENALTILESLKAVFPHIFLFDCDTYLSGSDAEFIAQMRAAQAFRPNVGLALPNATYGMMLDKRVAYFNKKRFRDFLRFPRRPAPLGNVLAGELGVPTVMIWDHLLTQAAHFLLSDSPVPRKESCSGSLEKLRIGLCLGNFIHYVPDSEHINIFERLGICNGGFLRRYVVPGQEVFLRGSVLPLDGLITDRILFTGNLNSSAVMSAYGNDSVVAEVTDYVTNVKCKNWETAAWYAYEEIASQKVAAGVAELHPDHSFYWSLGRELSSVVTTAFRITVFKSVGSSIDFYGGFTDPDFVAGLCCSGLFRSMGRVPLESLGSIYARYQFSVDITQSPFIKGSNAKVLNCFAAGGFMFVDWKDDLRGALGDLAEEFMYRNAEELTSKMEGLRRNPRRRLEIIQAVREIVSRDLNFGALLSGAICRAGQLSRA
jgi:Glycosyl transferases group 1